MLILVVLDNSFRSFLVSIRINFSRRGRRFRRLFRKVGASDKLSDSNVTLATLLDISMSLPSRAWCCIIRPKTLKLIISGMDLSTAVWLLATSTYVRGVLTTRDETTTTVVQQIPTCWANKFVGPTNLLGQQFVGNLLYVVLYGFFRTVVCCCWVFSYTIGFSKNLCFWSHVVQI